MTDHTRDLILESYNHSEQLRKEMWREIEVNRGIDLAEDISGITDDR